MHYNKPSATRLPVLSYALQLVLCFSKAWLWRNQENN